MARRHKRHWVIASNGLLLKAANACKIFCLITDISQSSILPSELLSCSPVTRLCQRLDLFIVLSCCYLYTNRMLKSEMLCGEIKVAFFFLKVFLHIVQNRQIKCAAAYAILEIGDGTANDWPKKKVSSKVQCWVRSFFLSTVTTSQIHREHYN